MHEGDEPWLASDDSDDVEPSLIAIPIAFHDLTQQLHAL